MATYSRDQKMTKHIMSIEVDLTKLDELFLSISNHIVIARKSIMRTIDIEMVKAYWLSGHDIVEAEQRGEKRADYGLAVLKKLSSRLQKEFGRGFSESNLKNMRQFYLEYQVDNSDYPIRYTVCSESNVPEFPQNLSWSHYRELMRVNNLEARAFYERESACNNWSVRELKRQKDSLLFDRLSMSKNKEEMIRLVHQGHEIISPQDAIKDPVILEFLGLPESHQLVESKLEMAIINNLQDFLLELGKGFAFVARQKRLSFSGDHFYADLVFYHVILKCYIIIDIKTHKLTHGDLGQMQLYVNYFDKEVKQNSDNPTIGLVLCTEKCNEMVKYMLGDKAKQIFASTYQFHLPTVQELEKELRREIKALNINSD